MEILLSILMENQKKAFKIDLIVWKSKREELSDRMKESLK